MPRVLILKAGTTDDALQRARGDYDDWFKAALDGSTQTQVIRPYLGDALPDPLGWDGVLITGSPLSVRDELPWMAGLGRWAVDAAAGGSPVLGVCLGHQLIGEVLGGWVGTNPRGLEVGTVRVELSEAGRRDPLFAGLPSVLEVQATHRDILVRPPTAEGVTLLGGNENTAWQAFAVGPLLRAVQFHPEATAETMETLMETRGQTHLGRVAPSDHGRQILLNWVRGWLS